MITEEKKEQLAIEKYNDLLLDIGTTLLATGAHCGRIERNIQRFATTFNIDTEVYCSFNGLTLTSKFKDAPTVTATHHKRLLHHGVHFGTLTEISLFSWESLAKKMSYEKVKEKFSLIKKMPHTNRLQILLGVGIASASLCLLINGNFIDALFAFIASIVGIFIRQEIAKRGYNIMIVIILSAFISSFIACLNIYFKLGASPEKALATSVLYLVPGVHLVNAIIDLLEGYVTTSLARGYFAGFILLCIAIGMAINILLFGINNF